MAKTSWDIRNPRAHCDLGDNRRFCVEFDRNSADYHSSGGLPDRRNRLDPAASSTFDVDGDREMARVTGLEPATLGVTGRYSNQLSYTRALA